MGKKKSIGQLMAEARWKKATPEQRAAVGRALVEARQAKRRAIQEREGLINLANQVKAAAVDAQKDETPGGA